MAAARDPGFGAAPPSAAAAAGLGAGPPSAAGSAEGAELLPRPPAAASFSRRRLSLSAFAASLRKRRLGSRKERNPSTFLC